MNFKFREKAQRWELLGPSVRPSKDQQVPGSGGFLAWSAGGQLQLYHSKDEDELSWNHEHDYVLKGEPLDTGKVEAVVLDSGLQVRVRFSKDHAGLSTNLEPDCPLVERAIQVGATSIQLTAGNWVLDFKFGDATWSAQAPSFPKPLPREFSMPSVHGDRQPVLVRWYWKATCTGFLAVRGEEIRRTPAACQYRDWPAGLIFDSAIPPRLMVQGKWSVTRAQPLSPTEWTGMLEGSGDVSLRDFVSATRDRLVFSAIDQEYEPEVELTPDIGCGKVYSAEIEPNGRIKPTLDQPERAWSFGPSQPFYPGVLRQPRRFTIYKPGKDDNTSGFNNTNLSAGALPSPLSGTGMLLLVPAGDTHVVGTLVWATKIAAGKWQKVEFSNIADKTLICWRGLIDFARLQTLTVDGKERRFLRLENGFVLDRSMWIAAPQAGIAMTRDADWWAVGDHPDRRLTHEAGGWRLDARSIGFDPAFHSGTVRRAQKTANPGALVILTTQNVDDACGPVLEIEPEGNYPRLRGWLADLEGCVHCAGAIISLQGKSGVYTLKPGETVAEKNYPERVKAALQAAVDDNEHAEGVYDGIRCLCEDEVITAILPEDSGIYALNA
jgi:hypothetical protein